MKAKNLLAMVKNCGENHPLFKDFLRSLPMGTKKLLDSSGFVGSLESNLDNCMERKTGDRYFFIFRAHNFDNVNREYFTNEKESALIDLQDQLNLRKIYVRDGDNFSADSSFTGAIDVMVTLYKELSKWGPLHILLNDLEDSDSLKEDFTEKTLLGFGRRKLMSTHVSIGLETSDRKYLLAWMADGPYSILL